MRHFLLRVTAGVCLLAGPGWSGPHGASGPIYPTLLCVVPMIGAGTLADPKRPLFTPVAGQAPADGALAPPKKSKGFAEVPRIVSYRSVLTDDGQHAIVAFTARDRAAFEPILAKHNLLAVFDLQTTRPDTLLASLRRFKKDLEISMLLGGAR